MAEKRISFASQSSLPAREVKALWELHWNDVKALFSALVNHIKILAGADIVESRKPQDGRISVALAGRDLDVRFPCVPNDRIGLGVYTCQSHFPVNAP